MLWTSVKPTFLELIYCFYKERQLRLLNLLDRSTWHAPHKHSQDGFRYSDYEMEEL